MVLYSVSSRGLLESPALGIQSIRHSGTAKVLQPIMVGYTAYCKTYVKKL